MSNIIHVTDDQFEEIVLQSKIPVLVDFWAEWCGPCKAIAPILDDISKDYDGKLIVAKINIDENQKEYYLREKMRAIQEELGDKVKKDSKLKKWWKDFNIWKWW